LAAFRQLHAWREAVAQREDKAPFRVIGNDPLLAVSRALPETADGMGKVAGLPASLARRHGPALLDAVRRARALPEAELPRLARAPRGPKDPKFDERVEKLKAARNRVAAEWGLDPGVGCGRPTLEVGARAAPPDPAGHPGDVSVIRMCTGPSSTSTSYTSPKSMMLRFSSGSFTVRSACRAVSPVSVAVVMRPPFKRT